MNEKSPIEGVEPLVEAPKKVEKGVKEGMALFKFIANIAVLYLGRIPTVFVGMMTGKSKYDE